MAGRWWPTLLLLVKDHQSLWTLVRVFRFNKKKTPKINLENI